MINIFISYRRSDTRADAGRLYDRFAAAFGDEHVFMDIEDIEPGENFVSALEETLESCDVLIALIGPRWLSGDGTGERLEMPDDFVRIEIESALARNVRVIPVLVGGAAIPDTDTLPDSLQALVLRQAFDVRDERYHQDVDRLIADIRELESPLPHPPRRRWRRLTAIVVTVLLALLVALAWRMQPWWGGTRLPARGAVLSGDQVKAMLVTRGFYHRLWNAEGPGTPNRYHSRVLGADVVVEDAETGLMWQKSSTARPVSFDNAMAYVSDLNARRFAGFDDWRIPTLAEAMSVLEPEALDNMHIDPVFERGVAHILFTADRAAGGRRWVVSYYDGDCHTVAERFNAWARAVRSSR